MAMLCSLVTTVLEYKFIYKRVVKTVLCLRDLGQTNEKHAPLQGIANQ
jgi:hypothetical protein